MITGGASFGKGGMALHEKVATDAPFFGSGSQDGAGKAGANVGD